MDLSHQFTVPAPLSTTWEAFGDIESVAECFPGAKVTGVDGDDFTGTCKVKLGPIALTYTGSGSFQEKDEEARRFVVVAKGKDKRGNGTAGATVTASFTGDESSTTVEVVTDLAITGKPAQFGRGVMQDVSDKLLQQFVTCLADKVSGPQTPEESPAEAEASSQAPAGAPTPVAEQAPAGGTASQRTTVTSLGSAPGPGSGGAGTASSSSAGASTARTPEASNEALDLGATVLPVLARAYWKQAAAAVGGLAVLVLLRRLFSRG